MIKFVKPNYKICKIIKITAPMHPFIADFYQGIFAEAGTTFLSRTAIKMLKATLSKKNAILGQQHAIRRGVTIFKHSLYYNTAIYLLARLQIKARSAHIAAIFLSNLVLERNNGMHYALRTATTAVLFYILNNVVRKVI